MLRFAFVLILAPLGCAQPSTQAAGTEAPPTAAVDVANTPEHNATVTPAEKDMPASKPSLDDLKAALAAAGNAHHNYESEFLAGKRDEQWPGFYAAYVLGRLGEFTTPTKLTKLIESAPKDAADWVAAAAPHVLAGL